MASIAAWRAARKIVLCAGLASLLAVAWPQPAPARATAADAMPAPRPARTLDGPVVPHGHAVPIGGALAYDNDAVWSRLVQLSGGAGSRWVVLATAAGDPDATAARIVATLQRHGAVAEHVPVAPKLAGVDLVAATRDPRWLERVRGARGVFFSGGAQERIVDTLLPGGRPTPLLEAIREVQRAGGVIAGTSAGAAVMSDVMFRDATDVLAVLKGRLRAGLEVDRGLGFVATALFVDQHFLERGRIGRMLAMMAAQGHPLGLGVDEDTAAILRGDEVEVIGRRGVLLADLSRARVSYPGGALQLRGARLTYLEPGDRLDLRTRVVTPSPTKLAGRRLDPAARDFAPYYDAAPFYADVLGRGALVGAMTRIVDGRDATVLGLAWDGRPSPPVPPADLGFEFRFGRDAATVGWFTGALGGEAYTIANVLLDVTPVRVARPAYRPWRR